jgi:hypothetical protein
MRWELADQPGAQAALFDESIFEREPGRGEFRGMEFLHVRASTRPSASATRSIRTEDAATPAISVLPDRHMRISS